MRRLALVVVAVALVGGALFVGWSIGSNTETVLVEQPTVPLTSPVRSGVLADSVFASGTVSYPITGQVRLTTGTVTAVGTSAVLIGDGVAPVEVDLRPLFLMRGERPMFRNLDVGDEGADVWQFQEGLARLGLYRADIDGKFGHATRTAWRQLQEDLGVKPQNIVLRTDIAFQETFPVRVNMDGILPGDPAAGLLLMFTRPEPDVTAQIPVTSSASLRRGMSAEIIGQGGSRWPATVADLSDDGVTVTATLTVEGVNLPPSFRVRIDVVSESGVGLIAPMSAIAADGTGASYVTVWDQDMGTRSEEHTSELQSH